MICDDGDDALRIVFVTNQVALDSNFQIVVHTRRSSLEWVEIDSDTLGQ